MESVNSNINSLEINFVFLFLRPSSSSSTTRPTILPTYSNGFETQINAADPSSRIMRCTSMDTVRRQEQISLNNSNEPIRTDSLLKQKMCSSKKHTHIPTTNGFVMDNPRSQSFSMTTIDANQQISNNRHHYQNGDFNLQKPRVYTNDDRSFFTTTTADEYAFIIIKFFDIKCQR